MKRNKKDKLLPKRDKYKKQFSSFVFYYKFTILNVRSTWCIKKKTCSYYTLHFHKYLYNHILRFKKTDAERM